MNCWKFCIGMEDLLLFLGVRVVFERVDDFGCYLVFIEFVGLWLCLFVVNVVCVYGSSVEGDEGFDWVE